MPEHLIAIDTYGSQRITHPSTQKPISAYKQGYSNATRRVLLALLGKNGVDVTPTRASYHYVDILSEVTVAHGHLLFRLTDAERQTTEGITRQFSRPAVYVWQNNAWYEFPNAKTSAYEPVSGYGYPTFNPTRYRAASPSTGEKASGTEGMVVEKSQHDGQTPWWWLRGDTYPQRDLLKRWGCRWSQKNKAWYYIGDTLPVAVQALIPQPTPISPELPQNSTDTEEDAPCSDAEAEAILGIKLAPQLQPLATPRISVPVHRFSLGQTVYLAHNLRVAASDNIPKLKMDTPGTIVTRYVYQPTVPYEHRHAYAVDFGQHGRHTVFERNLDANPQNLVGIERHEILMITFGTPQNAILAALETRQNIPQAYEVLDEIAPQSVADTPTVAETTASVAEPEPEKTSQMRVMAPEPLPNHLQQALQQVRTQASMVTPLPTNKKTLYPIGQAFCGELSGDVTGNVQCFGYATFQGILVYLNLGGPRMACEAIRAKLSKGQGVNVHFADRPSLELSAGETDGEPHTGKYTAYVQAMPEARYTSQILVHEWITQPNYGGLSTTFIFRTREEQAIAKLKHHVTHLVKVPVFNQWADYLWQAGLVANLIRRPTLEGDIDLWAVELDGDGWTRLITGGLEQRIITLPA